MSYRIVPTTTDSTNTPSIGLGISLPFNVPGLFNTTYTTADQVKSNLKNLLLTRIGERFMQPTFGTRLLDVVFEPSDDEFKQQVDDAIRQPINYWLPYVQIETIETITYADNTEQDHVVNISLTYSSTGFSPATITLKAYESGLITVQ
jgi:phage baseplate assembly protein W